MRAGSVILAVIGSCLAIILALIIALGGTFLVAIVDGTFDSNYDKDYDELGYDEEFDESMTKVAKGAINVFSAIFVGMLLIAGVLGLVGAFTVNKNNTTSGVLMIIAFVLCLFTIIGILPAILLLLGGVFALKKDKNHKNQILETPQRVNAFGEKI